ncbi:MAG: hypothetical protein GXY44_04170, partial [Phycisphaerales bacterium]|nr:hypothetical protein [Phycisphaerales bacterium]
MFKDVFIGFVSVFLGLCCGGCGGMDQQSADYEYPSVPPIWIVEDDPNQTIFTRKDLERDRKPGDMLVIPLYRYFQHDGSTDFLAIAHPFVYQQGKEIEKTLASFGQRDKLRRLIFWVPGYFPDGMGRVFPWVPVINGKEMVVLELQPCLGTEETEINSAMKDLLLDGNFTIGKMVYLKPPPPPYTQAKMSNEAYNISSLVRTTEYGGRFYDHECPRNQHLLWAFKSGTQIVNQLTPEEKKTVAEFAKNIAQGVETGSRNGESKRGVETGS